MSEMIKNIHDSGMFHGNIKSTNILLNIEEKVE
jgi:tRNA A-37 threonylcarbamoyl transferase component Bud32